MSTKTKTEKHSKKDETKAAKSSGRIKVAEKEGKEKKSLRAALLARIEKVRAHKKSSLGTRSKLIEAFQKDFSDRDPQTVQDALVRYINDAKANPLGKYLLTEDEAGIGITKTK